MYSFHWLYTSAAPHPYPVPRDCGQSAAFACHAYTVSLDDIFQPPTQTGSFPVRGMTFHVPTAIFSNWESEHQGSRLWLSPSSHITGLHVSPQALAWPEPMGEGPATRRSLAGPFPKPSSRLDPWYTLRQGAQILFSKHHKESPRTTFCQAPYLGTISLMPLTT